MVCQAKFAKFLKKLNNALLNLLQFEKEMGIGLQEMASLKRGERLRMSPRNLYFAGKGDRI